MPIISLTDFVDFAIAAGPSQLTKVREIFSRPEYDPKFDFWKPLREGIQNYHSRGKKLEIVLTGLTDPKKINRYPAAVKGYKKFIGKKSPTWFKPPSVTWSYGDLNVRINPELGLDFNGTRFISKLYFKDERPTQQRLRVVFELMRIALPLDGSMVPAVIDVGNSKLIAAKTLGADLSPLLQAQALAFAHMWKALSNSQGATAAGAP